jgi:hypothetical protein
MDADNAIKALNALRMHECTDTLVECLNCFPSSDDVAEYMRHTHDIDLLNALLSSDSRQMFGLGMYLLSEVRFSKLEYDLVKRKVVEESMISPRGFAESISNFFEDDDVEDRKVLLKILAYSAADVRAAAIFSCSELIKRGKLDVNKFLLERAKESAFGDVDKIYEENQRRALEIASALGFGRNLTDIERNTTAEDSLTFVFIKNYIMSVVE